LANAFEIQVKALLESTQIQAQLDALQTKLKPLKIDLNLGGSSGGIQQATDTTKEYTQSIEGLRLAKEKLTQSGGLVQIFKSESDAVDKTVTSTEKGKSSVLNYDSAIKRLASNEAGIKTLGIRLDGLTDSQKQLTNAEERYAQIQATSDPAEKSRLIRSLTADINAASRGTNTFAASIEYMTERFLQITIIIEAFRKIISTITDMIDTVSSLDASIVELKKVTDLTGDSLEGFVSRAYDVGSQLARTGQEVVDAAAIFSRSGYEIEDALDLSKTALMLMNVGDNINSVELAATSLISILKGYNFEADKAAYVTDLLNEISNNAAINFEDLTDGLTRTAAVFNQAGVSIEKTSALLTGANEILQNVEKSSTGLITISQRCKYYPLVILHGAYVQKCA
jgi:division protein CdvB (Snf7/Vps24/ESCRT-III family)